MDVSLTCPCGGELSLAEAPEVMACHTVNEWTRAHAQCVINVQTFYVVENEEEDDAEEADEST